MANKQIKDFAEDLAPVDTTELITQTSGITKKSKVVNILKRVFGFDDVFNDYLVQGLDLDHAGGSTAPTFANFRDGFFQHSFTGIGNSQNEGHFTIHVLHDIKPNTDVTCHIHWAHNIAVPTPGNVKWKVDYTLAKGYGAGSFGPATTLSTIQANGTQYQHMITNDDDMVITGVNGEIEPDTIILFKVYRDPNNLDSQDTFPHPAFILNIDLHYIRSRTGTRERNRPYTSGGFSA